MGKRWGETHAHARTHTHTDRERDSSYRKTTESGCEGSGGGHHIRSRYCILCMRVREPVQAGRWGSSAETRPPRQTTRSMADGQVRRRSGHIILAAHEDDGGEPSLSSPIRHQAKAVDHGGPVDPRARKSCCAPCKCGRPCPPPTLQCDGGLDWQGV